MNLLFKIEPRKDSPLEKKSLIDKKTHTQLLTIAPIVSTGVNEKFSLFRCFRSTRVAKNKQKHISVDNIARLKRVCALFCNCVINRISDFQTKTNEVSNFHAQYF